MDDREAQFAAFFAASWPRLFRTTYAVAGDRQLTEDALQTAFAQAWAAWP
jgi:DNA-directed RNA polymerase specialized sigma24 family protein